MSFLYIEPYEVRHEILVRTKDMEGWMDLGLRGNEYIEIDELEPLKQRMLGADLVLTGIGGDYLLDASRVPVDVVRSGQIRRGAELIRSRAIWKDERFTRSANSSASSGAPGSVGKAYRVVVPATQPYGRFAHE